MDSGLSLSKRYAEMVIVELSFRLFSFAVQALWKYVMRTNNKLAAQLRDLLVVEKPSEDAAPEKEEDSRTFRDYYMEQMTTTFGDDLDKLRQV